MATWNNQNKDSTTFTNVNKSAKSLTWDQATFTWNSASGTWDQPFAWTNQTKDSTTFVNVTKH